MSEADAEIYVEFPVWQFTEIPVDVQTKLTPREESICVGI